jgi:hypothetical protein
MGQTGDCTVTHFAIPVRIDSFVNNYPLFAKTSITTKAGPRIDLKLKDPGGSLAGELDGWVTGLINENINYTTCCIQMSHAINASFLHEDQTKMVGEQSYRRRTNGFAIRSAANRVFRYIAAVDEMKDFLDNTFEEGVEITSRADIEDKPGIVVFMGRQTYGIHTEIWTGDNFHQGFMRNNFASLTRPRVWFWSIGDPDLIDI